MLDNAHPQETVEGVLVEEGGSVDGGLVGGSGGKDSGGVSASTSARIRMRGYRRRSCHGGGRGECGGGCGHGRPRNRFTVIEGYIPVSHF